MTKYERNRWQKAGNKLPLYCLYKRPENNYHKIKLDNSFLKQKLVKILDYNFNISFDHNLKDADYFIRVSKVFLETRM